MVSGPRKALQARQKAEQQGDKSSPSRVVVSLEDVEESDRKQAAVPVKRRLRQMGPLWAIGPPVPAAGAQAAVSADRKTRTPAAQGLIGRQHDQA